MKPEELDRINRAEEIQRYTENRCEALEKRIKELIALINAERKRQEECDDVHLRKIAELEKENTELKAKIEEMKRDVMEYFGYEYNILVAKLLTKWEIKEK